MLKIVRSSKGMITRNALSGTVFALTLFALAGAQAQLGSPTEQTGLNAAVLKLFGDIKDFTSDTEVRMGDKSGNSTMTMTMAFSMFDGKIRADLDLARVKSKELPPEAISSLKQMGMDKMSTVILPNKKLTMVIYPSLRSYSEVPMTGEAAADVDRKYKLESTKLGNETIDGHPCEKNKVVISSDNGQKHEATVWNATDLRKFPVQIQMTQQDSQVFMHYTNVKLAQPDHKLFEPPAGFTKYPSVEKMMQESMMKALGK